MRLLIKNGRIINPATDYDEVADVLIAKGKVMQIAKEINTEVDQIIDAKGLWVTPGLIDMHVHLREPGFEHKETIESGCKAAAAGGYTTICCMPNTKPAIDSKEIVNYIQDRASNEKVNVLVIGALTKGQEGKILADIGSMAKAGICALSEDGKTVKSSSLMKNAMTYSKKYDLPIMCHCEDEDLAGAGVINAGEKAMLLGLEGISNESEDVMVARDILLAKATGAKIHICHVSTEGAVKLIAFAKKEGIDVTAEVTPHHFTLTDKDITNHDTNFKMNPPLRNNDDRRRLIQGLKDGSIDVIATDHAPHHEDEKKISMDKAPFGIIGLETAVALSITGLVDQGYLSPLQLVEKMSYNPAKRLGIDRGDISQGKIADITIIDPCKVYDIDKNVMVSKSKNTPFHSKKVKGKVRYTIVEGNIVYTN